MTEGELFMNITRDGETGTLTIPYNAVLKGRLGMLQVQFLQGVNVQWIQMCAGE